MRSGSKQKLTSSDFTSIYYVLLQYTTYQYATGNMVVMVNQFEIVASLYNANKFGHIL